MHVDWDWIKQRPQHIAEALNERNFDVLVLYVPAARRGLLRANPSHVRRLPLPLIPLRRYRLARALNRVLGPVGVGLVAFAYKPAFVLVTSPDLADMLPAWMSTPIHYDCMDLAEAFAVNEGQARWIQRSEERLVHRAASISVSSLELRDHLLSLGASARAVQVVRNGVGEILALPPREPRNASNVDIGYVGTISEWLDFDVLKYACEKNRHVRWHLWGPATVAIPAHPRITHHGVLPRHELRASLAFLDGFVMPFRLGPLIRAVDPVKIYEYLSWGRPVISVYYQELEQFRPLISFYRDPDEFTECIARLEEGDDEPSRWMVEEFLRKATWAARSGEMARAIVRAAR